jgi:UDP-N-acetylmuramoyl-tripeptide--D-alanyl-D-alanine ligase
MHDWSPERVAVAAGCELIDAGPSQRGPERVVIDSREAGPGALFIGLSGSRVHGGRFAAQALAAGCWGVLSTAEHLDGLAGRGGALLAARDPLAALQSLALHWRRELAAVVIGVTGSTGKTTTKELLRALLEGHRRVFASAANRNTEIGLPLELLRAPPGSEVVVLEMAMRGPGQIAALCRIAEPDVGVIVSIGPVHLELLGSLEAIAAAKAELIYSLPPEGIAVVPAGEPLLEAHLRHELRTITFGPGGEVSLAAAREHQVTIAIAGDPAGMGAGREPARTRPKPTGTPSMPVRADHLRLEVSFTGEHLRHDLLAAVAAALAAGVRPTGPVQLTLGAGRGQRSELPGGVTLIDDCYNANPMSMRAALAELASAPPGRRRVAVLGDMLELGPEACRYHEQLGREAARAGVAVLITVGPLAARAAASFDRPGARVLLATDAAQAASLVRGLVDAGDIVLVKGSRAVGLETVCAELGARAQGSPAAQPQPHPGARA